MEIWKDIENYKGYYQISNLGNVRSLQRQVFSKRYNNIYNISEKVLKTNKRPNGYISCIFSKNGIKEVYTIHKLVALSFIPNPENKPQINHINGIKTDNRAENLEWCTSKENRKHAFLTGLIRKKRLLTEYQVIEARKLRNTGMKYGKLAKLYNVSYKVIEIACKGTDNYSDINYPVCKMIHKVKRLKTKNLC